jgi:YidC/Oxa1 family membrane protein insertase
VLEPIYWGISWILLRWHALWDMVLPGREFLSTNWDWVLAIVFLVLTVRGVLFPVFVKQIKSQRAMQAVAPQIKALQEKHKGDRETLQREMMELYKREKANPLMGCLPMVVQIPVMWSLFHVLRHLKPTMPERLKSLYGWTAAQFDSASSAKLFGAPIASSFKSTPAQLASMGANGTTVKVVAGVLVAIMIVTTYMTSRQMILKTGWAEDPQQKMIQRLMLYGIPVSLLVSGTLFPIGVVIYWVTTNLFSLGQQFWVLRKYPPPPANKSVSGSGAAAKKAAGPAARPSVLGRRPGVGKAGAAKAGATGGKAGVPVRPVVPGPKPGAKPVYPKKSPAQSNGTTVTDGRAAAPKPGAKPTNPKKGSAAKRASG